MLKGLLCGAFGFVTCMVLAGIGIEEMNKKTSRIHKLELDKVRSEGFHDGWDAAVDSPSIRYQHYTEFKKLNEASN